MPEQASSIGPIKAFSTPLRKPKMSRDLTENGTEDERNVNGQCSSSN